MENFVKNPEEDWNKERKLIVRRELLPWWMKLCCWFFMLLGLGSVIGMLYGFIDPDTNMSIYGIESVTPFSPAGFLILAIMLFKSFAAYAIWFEKGYAIKLGKIDAVAGIALCVISMIAIPLISKSDTFSFRLEIIVLAAFYMQLDRMEYAWDNFEKQE